MRSSKKIRIAVQKSGRISEASLDYLKSLGIVPQKKDVLISKTNRPGIELLYVRSNDVPVYLENKSAQYGITGKNVLYEGGFDIAIESELDFAKCKLIIAVPKDSQIKNIFDLEGERIATSYPKSLKRFLQENGVSASIVKIAGSVEAAPALGLADAICDLTQTGKTLELNNLRIVEKVYDSTAVLLKADDSLENLAS